MFTARWGVCYGCRMSSEAQRPRVGRKRSEGARQAILDASLELLHENGYAALTTDAIARRAGTSKQTIYRWWNDKAEVVLEALAATGRSIRAPQTGDLEGDLTAFLQATFRLLRGPNAAGVALKALMAHAQLEAEFAPHFARFIGARREALRGVLVRHEARLVRDVDACVDSLFGAMWYRLLIGHAPLDARFARELAALVARGAT